jgi:hypothetical protein
VTTTGPNSAGTGANDATAGAIAWATTGNVSVSDNAYARAVNVAAGSTSQYLQATGFGFSIASDQEIVGILFEAEVKSSVAATIADLEVLSIKGGVMTGGRNYSQGAAWPIADTYVTYGSAASLWGRTWTPADINASNFGLALRVINNDGAVARTAFVDHVRCTIYHRTIGSTPLSVTEGFASGAGEFTTVNGTYDYTGGNANCTDPAANVEPEGLTIAGLTDADKTYSGLLSSHARVTIGVTGIGAGLYMLAGGTTKDPGLAVTLQPGDGFRVKDWDPDTGAFVTLGLPIADALAASGDIMQCEIVNTSLYVFRNGIYKGTATSPRLARIGKHGVRVAHDSAGSTADNFFSGPGAPLRESMVAAAAFAAFGPTITVSQRTRSRLAASAVRALARRRRPRL